jgi:hypothetical protein
MTMRTRLWKRPEHGSVAVEMAIILPIFLVLLAVLQRGPKGGARRRALSVYGHAG